MDKKDFLKRTNRLALEIIKFVQKQKETSVSRVINYQLLKAGTSVGANYRAACRGRSTAEFIAKLSIVEEEADETLYWLILYKDSGLVNISEVAWLIKETNEILSMVISSINTAKKRKKK